MSNGQEGGLTGARFESGSPTLCAHCGGQIEPHWTMCGWCGTRIDSPDSADGADLASEAPVGPVAQADASAALARGTALQERYRVDSVLGRGGFGITYRARDLRLDRDVAVKELFPLTAQRRGSMVTVDASDQGAFDAALIRFQREAATLARFSHPGIVRVFEVLEENATAYLVMELIEGSSMTEVLRERGGPLDIDEVLDVVVRVGAALAAVHDAGLLHRDVNPSNIMLDGTRRIVLIDFGLSRRYGDDISGSLTRAVTPGYAPPEQYAGSVQSGPPCDVFGLAATAYKLLTGSTPTNVFDRQAGVLLPAPDTLRPDVPRLVSAGLLDGMELDPGHRPATAEAFIDRLGLHGRNPGGPVLLSGNLTGHPDNGAGDPTHHAGGRPGPAVNPGSVGVADATAADRAHPAARPAMAPAPAPVAQPSVPPQVMPLRPAAFAPWHDGSAPVVGPAARWRGWITWPAVLALAAMVSASPVLIGGIVALVILPFVATVGDVEVHRNRQRTGAQRRRWHNLGAGLVAPARLVRNVLVGALRAVPAIAVGAIGVVVERTFMDSGVRPVVRDASVRLCGVAVALVLVVPARHGDRGYRTDLGTSVCSQWAMEGRLRPGWRAVTLWVVAVALIAFAAWLSPEYWPLT